MYLTLNRHDILAKNGVSLPFAGKSFYDLCTWRDQHSGLLNRVKTQLALIGLGIISLIESVVRIPLSLIACLFFDGWLDGIKFSILTSAYCLYGTLINLFSKKICDALIRFDFNLRFYSRDNFLFEACTVGRADLVEALLTKKGINPHRYIEHRISSALVPRLLGHPHLNHFFELNPYEKSYLELKETAHWLSLKGTVDLNGTQLELEGAASPWFFDSLFENFKKFSNSYDQYLTTLSRESFTTILNALQFAFSEHSYDKIASKIRNKELCFLESGWSNHGICLSFYGNYMAIGNEGLRPDGTSTFEVYSINPSLVTPEIIEEILMHQKLSRVSGKAYFYQTLIAKLSGKKDGLCKAFEKIAPKDSKAGICALASKKAAMRFAWAMLLCENPTEDTLERAKLEMKLFSDWAAVHLPRHKIPQAEIRDQANKAVRKKTCRLWLNRIKASFF